MYDNYGVEIFEEYLKGIEDPSTELVPTEDRSM